MRFTSYKVMKVEASKVGDAMEKAFRAFDAGRCSITKVTRFRMKRSPFFAETPRRYINSHSGWRATRVVEAEGIKCSLSAVVFSYQESTHDRMCGILSFVYAAILLYKALAGEGRCDCISINIYLAPIDKVAADSSTLSVDKINSGFCERVGRKANIVIYRREEWFKVLLHELGHAFRIGPTDAQEADFTAFASRNGGNPQPSLDEAYVELWARLLNASVKAYMDGHGLERHLTREKAHSRKLIPKIHKLERNRPSSTNAYAYYVVTGLMLLSERRDLTENIEFSPKKLLACKRLIRDWQMAKPQDAQEVAFPQSLAMSTGGAVE